MYTHCPHVNFLNNSVIYTDSVGETANVTVFLSTTTAPEVVLTVATLTGGGKQDVVVEGSYEPGIESLQFGDYCFLRRKYTNTETHMKTNLAMQRRTNL